MEQDVAGRVIGDAIQCTYLNLETTLFQPDVIALLPRESAERYKAIPVYQFGPAVTVAMTNPQDTRIVAALSRLLRHPVDHLLGFPDDITVASRQTLHCEKCAMRLLAPIADPTPLNLDTLSIAP